MASCADEVERNQSNLVAHCRCFGAFVARAAADYAPQERELIWDAIECGMELRSARRVLKHAFPNQELYVAKKAKKKFVRREYSKADVKELRAHSKARTPVDTIVKLTKRTEGSLRQKALKLGIGLGHQR
jgi:hypothetical protein